MFLALSKSAVVAVKSAVGIAVGQVQARRVLGAYFIKRPLCYMGCLELTLKR